MLESYPKLRAVASFLAHPMLFPVSRFEKFGPAAYKLAARLKLTAWTGPYCVGGKDKGETIPVGKLSYYHQSEVRLRAAEHLLISGFSAPGKIKLVLQGALNEDSLSVYYSAIITGFTINKIQYTFDQPVIFEMLPRGR